LCLLVTTLAEPVLQLEIVNRLRPLIYVVVDSTESMAIDDEYSSAQRAAIDRAVGRDRASEDEKPSRLKYVQSLFGQRRDNVLSRLAQEKHADLETFVFDGNTTSQVRRVQSSSVAGSRPRIAELAEKLQATGQVTAIGSVLTELEQQYGSRR